MRPGIAWLCVWLCACAHAPVGPFFDDAKYLQIGVDPRAEAKAVIDAHKAQGQLLTLRLDGEGFTALAFHDDRGRPSSVRVLTSHGIAVELDREDATAFAPELTYTLLPPPRARSHDADGDGFEEVFIEQRTAERSCVLVYRVRDVGTVDALDTSVQLFGRARCPRALDDVDGDGRTELVVDVDLGQGPRPPRIRVPLFAHDHRFTLDGDPAALQRFCANQAETRRLELAQARAALDLPAAYRLAVELSALANLAGQPAGEQLRVFDSALAGLVVSPEQSRLLARARETIYTGWNPEHPRDAAGELLSTPAR